MYYSISVSKRTVQMATTRLRILKRVNDSNDACYIYYIYGSGKLVENSAQTRFTSCELSIVVEHYFQPTSLIPILAPGPYSRAL